MHEDAICPGDRVLVVDDLLATGVLSMQPSSSSVVAAVLWNRLHLSSRLGLIVFLGKLVKGEFVSFILGGLVWAFVYKIHGSVSTTSIMSATFAALLFDLVGLRILGIMAGIKKK